MAESKPPLLARSVLFACSENAVRSPMAEALARHSFGRSMHIASVGVRPGTRDAFATAIMEEIGIDLSRHRPQRFEDLDDTSFDLIVTLSPEAHHRALEFTRTMAVDVAYWPTFDPTATEGARETVLAAYRNVRDGLLQRITATFGRSPLAGI
jgi:protein-tyrosine-phosphatase